MRRCFAQGQGSLLRQGPDRTKISAVIRIFAGCYFCAGPANAAPSTANDSRHSDVQPVVSLRVLGALRPGRSRVCFGGGMRLPFLQVEVEDSRRLGAQLSAIDPKARHAWWWRGLLEELWAWGLNLSGDDRPTGQCDHPRAADMLCGVLGWVDGPDSLVEILSAVNVITPTRGGGLRVRGIVGRYGAAWDRQQQQVANGRKGAKERWKDGDPNGTRISDPNGTRISDPNGTRISDPNGTRTAKTETETETETEKEETTTPVGGLRDLWNLEKPPECREWRATPKDRERSALARLKEQPSLEIWRTAIKRIHQSPFCRGENDRGWKAGPEWLLKPSTLTRILEGSFDGTSAKPSGADDPRTKDPRSPYFGFTGQWAGWRSAP